VSESGQSPFWVTGAALEQNPSLEGAIETGSSDTASVSTAAHTPVADLDPEREQALQDTRARRALRLGTRDFWASFALGGSFLATAVVLATQLGSERTPHLALVAGLIAAYAVLYRVEFEIGSGLAVSTQLAFVPMLFLLPLGVVPLAVAAGIMLGNVVELLEGRIHFERIFVRLANSWHAVGPVLVLFAAGEAAPALRHWPVYAAALAAQFLFEFVSTAARERLALGVRATVLIRYLSVSWVADCALSPIALLAALAAFAEPSAFVLVLPLAALLHSFARERRARVDHALELTHAYRGTAMLLGDVVEADDAYTGEHSRDVVSLSIAVAEDLGLDARGRRDTEFVALLHDVGKIRIPNEIINKPGPLTAEEREVVETHTAIGEEMLKRVGGVLGNVGHLVRSCHERFDGGGYPDGLAGEQIPLVARIVCCCDAYSAITTDRPYRKGRSAEEALAELRRCAGAQFDPVVVDALVRVAAA
jgi:HD-GYP domain-containing protein (c-di-GMP phosphodiesterase class II)